MRADEARCSGCGEFGGHARGCPVVDYEALELLTLAALNDFNFWRAVMEHDEQFRDSPPHPTP